MHPSHKLCRLLTNAACAIGLHANTGVSASWKRREFCLHQSPVALAPLSPAQLHEARRSKKPSDSLLSSEACSHRYSTILLLLLLRLIARVPPARCVGVAQKPQWAHTEDGIPIHLCCSTAASRNGRVCCLAAARRWVRQPIIQKKPACGQWQRFITATNTVCCADQFLTSADHSHGAPLAHQTFCRAVQSWWRLCRHL